MTEMRNSLKVKVGIYLVLTLTIAVFLFTFIAVRNSQEEFLQQAIRQAAQLSEVITRSTRSAMLQNQHWIR